MHSSGNRCPGGGADLAAAWNVRIECVGIETVSDGNITCVCMGANEDVEMVREPDGRIPLEEFALLRKECTALREILLPNEMWRQFRDWHAVPDTATRRVRWRMIRPRAGSRIPAINRSSVDLTEPFGPTTATRSAGLTENETLSNRTGPDGYSNESSDMASKDITPPGRPLRRRIQTRVGLYRFIAAAGRRHLQNNTGRSKLALLLFPGSGILKEMHRWFRKRAPLAA